MKRILPIVILILVLVGVIWFTKNQQQKVIISNYEECAAAGNPIAESYPATCRTKDGKVFTEDIGNELEKSDLIKVDSPRPNTKVASPLVIIGEARGTWFFEASFPARLVDLEGNELGLISVTATGEWMTTEFVPFTATLEFDQPATLTGKLILEKDNPSGLPENSDSLIIPVKF